MNIKFPKTSLVKCVFCYRSSNNSSDLPHSAFDDFDRHKNPSKLKAYTYRVLPNLQDTLQVGDAVVVHCQTGYQIAEVVEINAFSDFDESTFAPVIDVINMRTYHEDIEKAKALKMLKAKIEQEKKRLESMVTYELIAEKNPEFKALLEAFKAAGGEF